MGRLMLDDLPKEVKDRLEIKEMTDLTFHRVIDEDYTDYLLRTLEERRAENSRHSFIATAFGEQGSGKSYGMLSVLGFLSQGKMPADNIFFSYKDAVKNRRTFKSGTSILVDEQTREYGLDSQRITTVLHGLKEQLRKRSIHMAYCSPTLKEEYHSSMYLFESLFIDKRNSEGYFAYMTRERHCLGHVVLPHPEVFFPKEFIQAYEDKKDAHLDVLLSQGEQKDDVEEFAQHAMQTKAFLDAESTYVGEKGKFPKAALVQVLSGIFPEFQGGVMVHEIADRIKVKKELNGEWKI